MPLCPSAGTCLHHYHHYQPSSSIIIIIINHYRHHHKSISSSSSIIIVIIINHYHHYRHHHQLLSSSSSIIIVIINHYRHHHHYHHHQSLSSSSSSSSIIIVIINHCRHHHHYHHHQSISSSSSIIIVIINHYHHDHDHHPPLLIRTYLVANKHEDFRYHCQVSSLFTVMSLAIDYFNLNQTARFTNPRTSVISFYNLCFLIKYLDLFCLRTSSLLSLFTTISECRSTIISQAYLFQQHFIFDRLLCSSLAYLLRILLSKLFTRHIDLADIKNCLIYMQRARPV